MSWASEVVSRVKSAFDLYFGPVAPCSFLRLPADLFIDDLFPYLLIDDLLALRKTCKGLYLLSHEPIIWKRYMRRLQIPLAQLRPTFKFSEKSSNYEIEFLVTRACALDRSWRRNFPKVESERVLATQYKIIDLKLLPGGKFLIASAKDRCNYRFYILVYALDLMFGSRLIARLPTFFKVYDLQAKYMDYRKRPGIMISYTRRRFQNGAPLNLDISDYGHRTPIDYAHPLLYEACCVHMDLENIERAIWPTMHPWANRDKYLGMARSLPQPFCDILRYESPAEIHSPSLFLINDEPCFGCAIGNQSVRITRLWTDANHPSATMQFHDYPGYEGLPHRIRAWRYLPCQNGIMVFRSISFVPGEPEVHVVEFYDLPVDAGFYRVDAKYGYECQSHMPLNGEFVIADPIDPSKKMGEDHPEPHPREECPPTLWAFASMEDSVVKGSAYWCFRAEKEETEMGIQENFIYKVPSSYNQPQIHLNRHQHSERALPGSERTLLFEFVRSQTDAQPIVKMRRFFWPESRFPKQYPTKDVCYPVRDENSDPESVFAFRDLTWSDCYAGQVNKEGGLAAITWDETSGRICLASEDADKIYIWDLAPVCEPHHRLAYGWRQSLVDPGLLPDA